MTGDVDYRLQASDVVNILEGKVFYVGGEVGKPGEIAWKGGITVTRPSPSRGSGQRELRKATVTRTDGTRSR